MQFDPHSRKFRRGIQHAVHQPGVRLARKPNYDFEKRRKELDRKAKKDAKREDRLQRKNEEAQAQEPVPADGEAPQPE
jgi:hypothetical protein